jgi:hypothetical protein
VAAPPPNQAGSALVTAARLAFIDGLQIAAAASAIGSLALAGFVFMTLRHLPPSNGGTVPAPVPEAVVSAERVSA